MNLTPLLVSTDVVLFGLRDNRLHIALYQRGDATFQGKWSLPGGPLQADELLVDCASRKLSEDMGVHISHIEQLATFDAVNRDPRSRTISVAHYALVRADNLPLWETDDATAPLWIPVDELPRASQWAFDHYTITTEAIQRLQGQIAYSPFIYKLLPTAFTLTEAQELHEQVLGVTLDRRNFQKKLQDNEGIVLAGKAQRKTKGPPAQLYKLKA
jgi:8-oxo-dGTP diphosphatase